MLAACYSNATVLHAICVTVHSMAVFNASEAILLYDGALNLLNTVRFIKYSTTVDTLTTGTSRNSGMFLQLLAS